MSYMQRVAASIFPLSIEKKHIRIALDEWIFAGQYEDHEKPEETCQLCAKQGLRYKYLIENWITGNQLWVGSECIERFDVSVADPSRAGRFLSKEEAATLIAKLKNKMIEDGKFNSVLRSLILLKEAEGQAEQENPVDVDSFMRYYKINRKFTPSQGAILAWRLGKFKIKYNPRHFKIDARGQNKTKLLQLKEWQVKALWPLLSQTQQAMYDREKKRI